MAGAEEELSHNLVREWVTDRLSAARIERATLQSEWIGKGVAWPQTSGEHEDPTGVKEPDMVLVYVTVAGAIEAQTIEEMVDYLRKETAAEPRLGGRVEGASMQDGKYEIEIVEHLELGSGAQRIALRFTVMGPHGPVA